MIRRTALGALALALGLAGCVNQSIPPAPAVAMRADCVAVYPAAARAELPKRGVEDKALLAEAFTIATNEARCTAGLPRVTTSPAATQAAALLTTDMAARDFFSSASPVPGRETLRARMRLAGLGERAGRENLRTAFFMDYTPNQTYRTVSEDRCIFWVGTPPARLQRHSYATLAQSTVAVWSDGGAEQANLLAPGVREQGAAMAPSAVTELCGGLVVAQVLVE